MGQTLEQIAGQAGTRTEAQVRAERVAYERALLADVAGWFAPPRAAEPKPDDQVAA